MVGKCKTVRLSTKLIPSPPAALFGFIMRTHLNQPFRAGVIVAELTILPNEPTVPVCKSKLPKKLACHVEFICTYRCVSCLKYTKKAHPVLFGAANVLLVAFIQHLRADAVVVDVSLKTLQLANIG